MSEISLLSPGTEIARWAVLPRWAVFGKFPLQHLTYFGIYKTLSLKKSCEPLDCNVEVFFNKVMPNSKNTDYHIQSLLIMKIQVH